MLRIQAINVMATSKSRPADATIAVGDISLSYRCGVGAGLGHVTGMATRGLTRLLVGEEGLKISSPIPDDAGTGKTSLAFALPSVTSRSKTTLACSSDSGLGA
jgi:hypothetical protein